MLEVKYIGHSNCHPETCGCDTWGLVRDEGEIIARFYTEQDAEKALSKLRPQSYAVVKPHIYAQLLNELRDTALLFKDSQQLRAQLSSTLRKYIVPDSS